MAATPALAVLLVCAAAATNTSPQGEVLQFTATWCGPCQSMHPIVTQLQRKGYRIRKVDVDQHQDLVSRYNISSIPAFVLVVNGKEVDRVVGAASRTELEQLCSRIPATKAAPKVQQRQQQNDRESYEPPTPKSNPPIVTVADGKKPSRFQIPFLSDRNRNSREVEIEPVVDEAKKTVRSKFDRPDEVVAEQAVEEPRERSAALASSVRIRIKDEGSLNFGSGTVIDSRPGQSIVLTCGHIFRGLSENAVLEVDVFSDSNYETLIGKAIDYNIDADVGLIAIPTETAIPVCRVANEAYKVSRGDRVASVGCGGGEPPSEMRLQVTELNRYQGPDNIECTGVPVPGRSGGGLFSADGEVIGVCFASDKPEGRGLYAALKVVHELLDKTELSHLYLRDGSKRPGREEPAALASAEPFSRDREERRAGSEAPAERSDDEALAGRESLPREFDADKSPEVSEALEHAGNAEVICIVRSPETGERKIVIINRATPKLVSFLEGEFEQQPQETMHSMKPRDPFSPLTQPTEAEERDRDDNVSTWQERTTRRIDLSQWPQPMSLASAGISPTSLEVAAPVEPQRYRRSNASR